MALVEIELPIEKYSYVMDVSLSGIIHKLGFEWNSRLAYWSYNLSTSDNVSIIVGQRLTVSVDLLSRFNFENAPEESLYLYDTNNLNEAPTFEGLGTRWRLMYGTVE